MSQHPVSLHRTADLGPVTHSDGADRAPATHFSRDKQVQFLDHLAQWGSVRQACRQASVAPQTVYRHRRGSHEFALAWDAALLVARARVEDVLADRALNGIEEVVYYHGEEIGRRRRFDSRLLLAHLGRLDKAEDCGEIAEIACGFDGALDRLKRGEPVSRYGDVEEPSGADRVDCPAWADESLPFETRVELYLADDDDEDEDEDVYADARGGRLSWTDERLPFIDRLELYLAHQAAQQDEDEEYDEEYDEEDEDERPDSAAADEAADRPCGPAENLLQDSVTPVTPSDSTEEKEGAKGGAETPSGDAPAHPAATSTADGSASLAPLPQAGGGGHSDLPQAGNGSRSEGTAGGGGHPTNPHRPFSARTHRIDGEATGPRVLRPLDPDETLSSRLWPGGPINDGRLSRYVGRGSWS